MAMQGHYFTKAAHVSNWWMAKGVLPLRHHGVIMQASNGDFLSLDHTRSGLEWNLAKGNYGVSPWETPSGTDNVREIQLTNGHPAIVNEYINNSGNFKWVSNNCSRFAKGIVDTLR
jgi:hypothetical protein